MKTFLLNILLCRKKRQCCTIVFFTVISFSFTNASAQCTTGTCTNTISANSNANITVTSGQVYCFTGGTFTGSLTVNTGGQVKIAGGIVNSSNTTINGLVAILSGTFSPSNFVLNSGATICNGPGGTLTPPGSMNTYQGTITNYGSADFANAINTGNSGIFDNFGTARFRASFNWNGAFTLTNEVGAIMTYDAQFNMSNGSTFNNRGKTYANSDFNVGNPSTFNNTGRVEVKGTSTYSGTVNNSGFVFNNGPSGSSIININSGSTVHNTCRFITTAGFNNNSQNTVNDGLIWVLNGATGNNPDVQINGQFNQTVNGLLRGTSFTNSGTVSGNGNYYFTGTTLNQGAFGSGSDAPNFYDVSNTPTTSNRGFDNQNPNTNVATGETHNTFTPADTTNYLNGCSNDFLGTVAANDSTRTNVSYPTTNPLTIPIGSFIGTSLSSGIQNGTITKLIFTALPANCSYIIINGIKYGPGFTTFPANGDTITIAGATSTITLGLLATAQTAGKITVPFKVVNSQGATSANTANVTQPFSGVLPVTFGNISATSSNCTITINFETLTEQNNKAFVIEYSTDGNTWVNIATILSKGDATFKQSYSFVHASAVSGGNYYRIKQIDKDGNSTYSSTLYVNNNCTGSFTSITSYPNPITDHITVSFPNTTGLKTVKIVDILGRVLQTTTTSGSVVNLSTSNLIFGIYGLEVIADGKRIYTQKLLKQ